MARKSMKDAAAQGASVFNAIAVGNVQSVPDVQDVPHVQGKPQLERLNLKIPAEIKEYLNVAAAKASIAQRRNISLTEYLIQLVREDMAKNNE